MSIIGWIVNGFAAIVMLSIFILMGTMVIMRIGENKSQINTLPKILKTIGKYVGSYIVYLAISLLVLLAVWIVTMPPYPYRAFIGCFILGLTVGYFIAFNRKK